MNKKIVLLPCAGSGSRFGGNLPKQYSLIHNKTILEHTLKVFLSLDQIDKVIIVTLPEDPYINSVLSVYPASKVDVLKVGGTTRAQSVINGLNQLNFDENDWILVHDVARCCITPDLIKKLISELEGDSVGGILAISATDTIKLSTDGVIIDKTLDRNTIYQAQTPQMFRFGILKKALNSSNLDQVTDEASSVESINLPIKLVQGESSNIKVTYPIDVRLAEIILKNRS